MVINNINGAKLNGTEATVGIKFNGQIVLEFVPAMARAVAEFAKQWVGVTPYVYGGNNLQTGCDIAPFIVQIYQHFGVNMPSTLLAIWNNGPGVQIPSTEPLQLGDIIMQAPTLNRGGIYVGDKNMVACLGPDGSYANYVPIPDRLAIKRILT